MSITVFSSLVTSIVALSAIVSPIITTIINNKHILKLRALDDKRIKYEESTKYKQSIIENYIKYAGRCISHADQEPIRDYGEYYFLALTYAPNDIREQMKEIHSLMLTYKWDKASAALESLIPNLELLIYTL